MGTLKRVESALNHKRLHSILKSIELQIQTINNETLVKC